MRLTSKQNNDKISDEPTWDRRRKSQRRAPIWNRGDWYWFIWLVLVVMVSLLLGDY